MEIGKKKVTKDGTVVDLWGTYGKRFTNGHKTFTSDQVHAVIELQEHEERFRANFEREHLNLCKPRDPMVGEATPRDINGEVIMNMGRLHKSIVTNGHMLFPQNRPPAKPLRPKKLSTGQIGVPDGKYEILGNKEDFGIMHGTAQPLDLFEKTKEDARRKETLKTDMVEYERAKMQVMMERQQKDMKRKMARMTIEMEKNEERMNTLTETLRASINSARSPSK